MVKKTSTKYFRLDRPERTTKKKEGHSPILPFSPSLYLPPPSSFGNSCHHYTTTDHGRTVTRTPDNITERELRYAKGTPVQTTCTKPLLTSLSIRVHLPGTRLRSKDTGLPDLRHPQKSLLNSGEGSEERVPECTT